MSSTRPVIPFAGAHVRAHSVPPTAIAVAAVPAHQPSPVTMLTLAGGSMTGAEGGGVDEVMSELAVDAPAPPTAR